MRNEDVSSPEKGGLLCDLLFLILEMSNDFLCRDPFELLFFPSFCESLGEEIPEFDLSLP